MGYQFRENGGAHFNEMIRNAVENGEHTYTITGNWEIEEAIKVPSDFALILDNCHLRMKDGVISNMITNEHIGCLSPLVKDYDIVIEGRGRVILDGGNPNGLHERTMKSGQFPGVTTCTVNSPMLFAHVDGIRIRGLQIRNQRYWGMTFVYCGHGVVQDIEFRSNDTWIDENGQAQHGIFRGRSKNMYEAILVKNSDGIDLRCGCHDFIIENITGYTEDDTVALTALFGGTEQKYYVEGALKEICNITIRNVNSAALCSNVRLLNGDGVLLHDILVDGVFDAMRECRFGDIGLSHVKIGDSHNYGQEMSKPGEVYNITVKNVHAIGKAGPLKIECVIHNLSTENIHHSGPYA